MIDLAAARKYARSLFDEAKDQNQLLACQQGLRAFAGTAQREALLREVLAHPAVSHEEKANIIQSALGEFATPLLKTFLSLIVKNRRLALLPVIAHEFQDEVDRFHNVQALKVRSAYPLSDAQQQALQVRLEAWLESKVRMQTVVDPELIGGLVIETRDYVIDQSFKGQLARLRHQLAG